MMMRLSFLLSLGLAQAKELDNLVKGLGDDTIIGRMVYVCPNDLGIKRAAFERIGDDNKYSLEVSVIVAHVASYLSYDICSGIR